MRPQRPINTDDLTGSVKLFAERLEPRLQAGARTFQQMRIVVAALAPLVFIAFSVGIYSMTLARKSDVSAMAEIEAQRHTEIERRTSVLEDARKSEEAARIANEAALVRHFERIDDRLEDILVRLGDARPQTKGRK